MFKLKKVKQNNQELFKEMSLPSDYKQLYKAANVYGSSNALVSNLF